MQISEYSFNPLGINTALNHNMRHALLMPVSIPYGLTLLSNLKSIFWDNIVVSIPYGLTLLSNVTNRAFKIQVVSIPYGLTLLSNTGSLWCLGH